jgi:hypothetical protein
MKGRLGRKNSKSRKRKEAGAFAPARMKKKNIYEKGLMLSTVFNIQDKCDENVFPL